MNMDITVEELNAKIAQRISEQRVIDNYLLEEIMDPSRLKRILSENLNWAYGINTMCVLLNIADPPELKAYIHDTLDKIQQYTHFKI